MRKLCKFLTATAVLSLAGCSGGSDQATSKAAILENVVQVVVAQRTANAAPVPTPTREWINSLNYPILELIVEERDATAYLFPRFEQTDARPGTLRTWRTADDSFIVLRDGVLVTTRGVGDDLGSTNADAAVAAVRSVRPVSGPHTMYLPSTDRGTNRIDLTCQMQSLGSTRIGIIERGYDVVHLRQTCTGADKTVVNDYWVDRRGGTVWQSRQWGGPGMGYIRTRLLK